MMKKVHKFLLLPFQQKKLFCKSLLFVGLIRLGLWILPYKFLVKILSSIGSTKITNQTTDWEIIKEVTNSVKTSAKYIYSASCLTQALATQTLLRLQGQRSNLKFGVDKDENEKLIAHAWIEIDNKIIIGGSADIRRYSVLSSSKEQFV